MTTTAGIETRVAAPGDPAHPARAPRPRARRSGLAWLWGVVGVAAVVLVWELYKWLAPEDGVVVAGLRILPRTTDLAMPHVWVMVGRLFEPVTRQEGSPPLWGVMGRKAGSIDGFNYSAGLKASGIVWTAGTLDQWITFPKKMVRDTMMLYRQNDPKIRKAIIDYIATQKD